MCVYRGGVRCYVCLLFFFPFKSWVVRRRKERTRETEAHGREARRRGRQRFSAGQRSRSIRERVSGRVPCPHANGEVVVAPVPFPSLAGLPLFS